MDVSKCSVVVCTYNRLTYLKKCIDSLLQIDFPDYEIIIVNDGSTDKTRDFLNSLNNSKIKIIHHNHNQGLSRARNTGIQAANSDVIVFTDDDCIVDRNWLTELLKGFTHQGVGFVMGQVFYRHKDYVGYFPERLVSNKNAHWPMGCNMAYRKRVFEDCGYFDNFFFKYNNEDSEMALRAVNEGYQYQRLPNAIVFHQAVNWTTKSLLRSAKNASVWPILKKKYPRFYLIFNPSIKFGVFINIEDYLYIFTMPVFIPLLLIRYIIHGKRDLRIFFVKWPIYFLLRRFYIYKEAVLHKIFII